MLNGEEYGLSFLERAALLLPLIEGESTWSMGTGSVGLLDGEGRSSCDCSSSSSIGAVGREK